MDIVPFVRTPYALLTRDLFALQGLFLHDAAAYSNLFVLVDSFVKGTPSDLAVRQTLMFLRNIRIHEPRPSREQVDRVVRTLDRVLDSALARGGTNYDFAHRLV